MAMRFLRAYCERQAVETGAPGAPIRFVASTDEMARDGKALNPSDFRLDNFRRNPVFLWVHDYGGRNLPIGRVPNVEAAGGQLLADVEFDQADDFARSVESKYRRGFLNAVSVGWQDVQEGKATWHDLLDISGVPVPADPNALKAEEGRALRLVLHELESGDARASDAPVWRGVSSAMLDVFLCHDAMEDEQRRALYNVLERVYRRLDKEPPEFQTGAELALLGPEEIRGLFLEGEIEAMATDMRAGAMLSARNKGDLEQAVVLIQAVLERATKEEPPKEPPPSEEDNEQHAHLESDALLAELHRAFMEGQNG